MTPPAPSRDVLAVTVGAGGIRARRTGAEHDAPDSFVEIPGAPGDRPPGPDDAVRLVAELGALTHRDGRPPQAAVAALPDAWQGSARILLDALTAAFPRTRAVVVHSLVASAVGGLGGVGPAVCLDLGVDSTLLATDAADVWHRSDGWGPLLGSRGSGAWLGAQGLAAALRARDGVPGGSYALLDAGRVAYGPETSWPDLIRGADAATALTTFAPTVCDLAPRDPVARAIVETGAAHLADTVEAAHRLLPHAPVCVVGGLLYLDAVRVALASALGQRHIFLVPGLGGALEGARLVGEHLLSGGALPHRPPYVHLARPGALGA